MTDWHKVVCDYHAQVAATHQMMPDDPERRAAALLKLQTLFESHVFMCPRCLVNVAADKLVKSRTLSIGYVCIKCRENGNEPLPLPLSSSSPPARLQLQVQYRADGSASGASGENKHLHEEPHRADAKRVREPCPLTSLQHERPRAALTVRDPVTEQAKLERLHLGLTKLLDSVWRQAYSAAKEDWTQAFWYLLDLSLLVHYPDEPGSKQTMPLSSARFWYNNGVLVNLDCRMTDATKQFLRVLFAKG